MTKKKSTASLSRVGARKFGLLFFKIFVRNFLTNCASIKCVDLPKCESEWLFQINKVYKGLISGTEGDIALDNVIQQTIQAVFEGCMPPCVAFFLYREVCEEIFDPESEPMLVVIISF